MKALAYTGRVFKEALRLYPSAWGLSRSTLEPVEIAGVVLPRNSTVLVSPWTLGRDPRWFPEPLRFDPDRYLRENARDIPHYAYIPLGGGARTCLGSHFAMMEAAIILAAIAQRFRLLPLPGSTTGAKSVAFTLRPDGPMRVVLQPLERNAATRPKSQSVIPTRALRTSDSTVCPYSGRIMANAGARAR